MTTDSASHDAVLDRLSAELADVGRRVDRIRQGMATLRTAPTSAHPTQQAGGAPTGMPSDRPVTWPGTPPAGMSPPPMSPPPPSRPPTSTPPAGWAPPGAWTPWARAATGPTAPTTARPQAGREARPWEGLSREGLGARLLAVTGAVVTLLGVVMLLVLAARNGWFGPGARVIGGAFLGLVLVGAGMRVHDRERTVGGIALAATGVAALYLDVAAASALYHYLPSPAALVLAAVVLAGGLFLADRWRHEWLALGVLLGGGILAPVAAKGVTPLVVGLLVVAQLAVVPAVLRRGWPRVLVVVTVLAAFEALYALGETIGDPLADRIAMTVAGVAVLAVAAGTAVAARDRISTMSEERSS